MPHLDILLGALLIFSATAFGAMLIIIIKKIGPLGYSVMLSFSAGIMAYSVIGMLAETHDTSGDLALLFGVLLGVLALYMGDKMLPHVHAHIRGRQITESKKKAALIAGGVTLHNIPEGLAVASAFASSTPLGWIVATAIALQDIPEGFMVSAPLLAYGVRKWRAFGFGLLSATVEGVSAILGYFFLSHFMSLIPLGLAFAAGAMSYVIFAELLPDAFRGGKEKVATLSFLAGAGMAFVMASVLFI